MRLFEGKSLNGVCTLAENQGFTKPVWAKFDSGIWTLWVNR